MGPEELDNLLASIRAEGTKERSALALYKGTRGTDLVNESIDERIVNILGLGQVFDIDYATYLTLLKEKLVQISMGGGSLAREEQMLLQDEFKRVKGRVGRFKINKRSASVGAISGAAPLKVSKDKFFLTSSAVIPENPGVAKVSDDLKGIEDALDKILKEIRADNAEEKKQAELERRQKIRNRRVSREKLLEKSQQKVTSVVNKLFTPVRGILDKLFRFIFFGLLGKAFQSFINWFSDPANKEKVSSMFRFLKDFWPAILGGLAFFFTPLGGFVKGIVGIVTTLGPKLFGLIAKYPKIAAAVAAAGLLIKAATSPSPDPERAAEGKTQLEDTQDYGGTTGAPLSGDMFEFTPSYYNGGEVINTQNFILGKPIEQVSGKITSTTGARITGAGPDTQLIAAQPGEFIISKNAVNTYGSQFFMNLNKEGGGTNIPKFVNNIQFAQGGGMVGGLMGSSTSMSKMVGGLMGSSTNRDRDYMTPPNPEPTRKITLPSAVFSKSAMSSSAPTETAATTSAPMASSSVVSYNNNMLSPTQRITLPPSPPVRSKKPNLTVLPEIVRNSGAGAEMTPANNTIDSFSPSQSNSTRTLNFAVYGIEGMS